MPFFLYKMSWDLSKKRKCDNITNRWKMMFQASDFKGSQFLDLLDDNDNIIKLSYIKRGAWLKFFSHFNSLYAKASREITNHALMGEYRLRFFLREKFKYLCRSYPIELRQYIFHEYKRFN